MVFLVSHLHFYYAVFIRIFGSFKQGSICQLFHEYP